MESGGGEDETRQVGKEMCPEEARRRRGGEVWREGELWEDVVTKRAGELWQGGEDKSCDKKEKIEGEL